jgi:hypothetical protein
VSSDTLSTPLALLLDKVEHKLLVAEFFLLLLEVSALDADDEEEAAAAARLMTSYD